MILTCLFIEIIQVVVDEASEVSSPDNLLSSSGKGKVVEVVTDEDKLFTVGPDFRAFPKQGTRLSYRPAMIRSIRFRESQHEVSLSPFQSFRKSMLALIAPVHAIHASPDLLRCPVTADTDATYAMVSEEGNISHATILALIGRR
jgi:hypothetical protein